MEGKRSVGRSRGRACKKTNTEKAHREASKTRSGRGRSRGKKKNHYRAAILTIGMILVFIILFAAARYYPAVMELFKDNVGNRVASSANNAAKDQLAQPVTVEGISLSGMSKQEAKNAIRKQFPWDMKVVFGEDTYEIPDLSENKIDILLDQIFGGQPDTDYALDTSGLDEAIKSEITVMASKWNRLARAGVISGYDLSTDTFIMDGAEKAISIDQDRLAAEISQAVKEKRFDAVIEAVNKESDSTAGEEVSGRHYKTLSVYTTNTTSSSARNNNIDLSAKALNGTVIKPGEEFSFNKTVGQRTKAKGYKAATAYSDGEVVQEIGGGVCQLSSTLYNTAVMAGLEITKRISHTFEPSYVTPGQDATVSWGGPDFCFRNNSDTPIGIRASYADRKLTISIYGIPILEDGVAYSLKSKKITDTGIPAPTYIEDQTLEPGAEVTKKSGSRGSKWETRLVITKNDEVISSEIDHTSSYKGHAPVVARNTAVTKPAESSSEAIIEVLPPETEQSSTPSKEIGPGISTGPGSTPGQDIIQGPGAGLDSSVNAPSPQTSENHDGPATVAPIAPGP